MPTFRDVQKLYSFSGEQVVYETQEFTQKQFGEQRDCDLPVLICAYNEEDDLPVTLAALGRSTIDVHPYVVDNGSTDRTAEFASSMGATVLEEPKPAKIYALAKGLGRIFSEGHDRLLFTDADTIMSSHWGRVMTEELHEEDTPTIVEGPAFFHDGERLLNFTNTLRSMVVMGRHAVKSAAKKGIIGRGHNMSVQVPSESLKSEVIKSILKCEITYDDSTIGEVVRSHGKGVFTTRPKSTVVTRGDRFQSLSRLLKAKLDPEIRKGQTGAYSDWYERVAVYEEAVIDLTVFDKTNNPTDNLGSLASQT